MKYLKLFENFNREDIDSICKKYGIKNYTINEDGSIDGDGDVDIHGNLLTKLPIKFRNVSGYFNCYNNNLTTLEGCPISVSGDFNCQNNELTSFEGCAESIGGYFNCYNNKLTSLIGGPKYIGGDFTCRDNKIRTLEGFPINLGGDFSCMNNPVFELWRLFKDKDKVELFNDFGITDGEVVIMERLNEFLEMIGKSTFINTRSLLEMVGYEII